jgi:restriction system protein
VKLVQRPDVQQAIVVGVMVASAYLIVRYYWRDGARRSLIQKVQGIIEQQKSSLVRRKAQLVWQDAYGKPHMEKWDKEIEYFITNHIEPSLKPREHAEFKGNRVMIVNLIGTRVEAAMRDNPAIQAFSESMNPTEFEAFCAEELRRVGWNSRVTRQSRDQGVDVVAEKGGVRVVLQCKLYSKPVGNNAVREAAAARAHEQAHHGIVVTNNRYTSDAEQLATTNGILLLHFSDLRNLDSLLNAVSRRGLQS